MIKLFEEVKLLMKEKAYARDLDDYYAPTREGMNAVTDYLEEWAEVDVDYHVNDDNDIISIPYQLMSADLETIFRLHGITAESKKIVNELALFKKCLDCGAEFVTDTEEARISQICPICLSANVMMDEGKKAVEFFEGRPIITRFAGGEIVLKGKTTDSGKAGKRVFDSGDQIVRVVKQALNIEGPVTIVISEARDFEIQSAARQFLTTVNMKLDDLIDKLKNEFPTATDDQIINVAFDFADQGLVTEEGTKHVRRGKESSKEKE